jgi:TRAP-type C4-dicarboxylate transport system permease small subunit
VGPEVGGQVRDRTVSRVLAWVEWLLNLVGAVLVAVILVSVCSQVIMRYGFNNATMWSDPVASAAMAWLTFIAMAAAVRTDSNMSVRFTWNWFGPRARVVLEFISLFLTAGFAAALSISAWQLMAVTDTATVEGLPFSVSWAQMYAIILVSGAFIMVFVIERVVSFATGPAK